MTRPARNMICLPLALAVLTLGLTGCGSSQPQQAPLTFPYAVNAQGYATTSGVGLGQDPAEMAAINPFDPIALNNLAVLEASRGRYQQATSLLQRAVKLAPARADIAANLANLQRWLAQAEGQAALGLTPQPLQLPYQESGVPDVPPLWVAPSSTSQANRPVIKSVVPAGSGRPPVLPQPETVPPRLTPAPTLSAVPPTSRPTSR